MFTKNLAMSWSHDHTLQYPGNVGVGSGRREGEREREGGRSESMGVYNNISNRII